MLLQCPPFISRFLRPGDREPPLAATYFVGTMAGIIRYHNTLNVRRGGNNFVIGEPWRALKESHRGEGTTIGISGNQQPMFVPPSIVPRRGMQELYGNVTPEQFHLEVD